MRTIDPYNKAHIFHLYLIEGHRMNALVLRLLVSVSVTAAVGILVAAMLYSSGGSFFAPIAIRTALLAAGIAVIFLSVGGLLGRIPAVFRLVRSSERSATSTELISELKNVLVFQVSLAIGMALVFVGAALAKA